MVKNYKEISQRMVFFEGVQSNLFYFKVRNFRGQKLSRISPTAKLLYFAGINFRGWPILRYFAGEEKMKVKFFLLFVYFQSISITVLRKSMESQIIE